MVSRLNVAYGLIETRHGMLMELQTTQAPGTAWAHKPAVFDDASDCVAVLWGRCETPHLTQDTRGPSGANDGRTKSLVKGRL